MSAGFIYKITNKVTGMIYIGQTTRTPEERFEDHKHCKTSYIGRAIRKYRVENFTVEVLEECETADLLNERERFWIAFFKCRWPNGYNMTDGGEGNWERTPESIEKMSRKGMHHTEETRRLIAISSTGRHPSEELKQKLSQAQPNRRAVVCVETNEIFETMAAAAKCKNVGHPTITRACKNPGRTAGGYHWRFVDEPTTETSAAATKKRPVVCVETNETFESIRAAAKHCNIDRQCVSRACKDSLKMAGGYHWRFKDEQPTEPQPSAVTPAGMRTPKRPVVCVETNEVFESISAAARSKNLRITNISRACQTQRNTAGGYHWRFVDETTT